MRASGYARAVGDWYVEDADCVDAMLRVERFSGHVWDPSCGCGNIPRAFRLRGIECHGSDIVDRGFGETPLDFLSVTTDRRVTSIVSNPPYRIIENWIEKALELTDDKVVVLARLAFLEGQQRRHKLQSWPLARVWVSSRRISMPPGGENLPAKGGSIAYAWFVLQHGYDGKPVIGWI